MTGQRWQVEKVGDLWVVCSFIGDKRIYRYRDVYEDRESAEFEANWLNNAESIRKKKEELIEARRKASHG